jgi:hypothetical protein
MKTMPLVVQLSGGINNKTSDANAIHPGISYSENTDFTKTAVVGPRPSLVSRNILGSRVLTNGFPAVDPGTIEVATAPFSFTSMFKYRDSLGERPGLAANGRIWTWEDDRFTDRTYCGTARYERLAEFDFLLAGASITEPNAAIGYNFMPGVQIQALSGTAMLSGTKPSIEGFVPSTSGKVYGGACSVVDGNGDIWNCTVGQPSLGPAVNIVLVTRKNNNLSITTTTLKTDCVITVNAGTDTRSTVCCTDENSQATFGVPCIWAAYPNAAGSINVMRINAATGAIIAQSTYALANITALSIAVNSSTNTLVMGIMRTGVNGAACRLFNATTCVNTPAGDNQFNGASPSTNTAVVVIGISDQATPSALVAYQENSGTQKNTIVGKYIPATPTSFILKSFGSDDTLSGWIPAHNPVLISGPNNKNNKRAVLGVYYDRVIQAVGTNPASLQTTYLALDFTDCVKEGVAETRTWGTNNPGILAIGTADSDLHPPGKPQSAIVSTALDSYRFGGFQYKSFSSAGGQDFSIGINQIVLTYPKAAAIGEETVLSGSVPRSIARGYAFESIFVQGSPEVLVVTSAGGSLNIGSHTIQACWKWIDEAGVVHRSAPSQAPITAVTSAGNQTYSVTVTNLILHNRSNARVFIELYMTAVNPTTTSPKTLAVSNQQAAGATSLFLVTAESPNGALSLYTNNGAVLQNTVVSADGGIATLNRRLFVSDGKVVFASKLIDSGNNNGISWNDEGPLSIRVPTPAGRIVSLEALDDKLFIFCEHGIFMTQGDGPDDTGLGSQFLSPVQISELGAQNERATVATAHGVAFYNPNTTASGLSGYGGVFLIDRGLNVKKISDDIQDILISQGGSTFGQAHLAYVPERDLLVVNRFDSGTGAAGEPVGGFFLVLDMSAGNAPGQWSLWTTPNSGGVCLDLVGANGVLWGLFSNTGSSTNKYALGSFDGVSGTDAAVDALASPVDYRMLVRTNHIFANNSDGLGWSRIRTITPTGDKPLANTYTQTIGVTLDQEATYADSTVVTNTTPSGTPWPVPRDAAEYRLPNQKCSQIQITLSATPAVARWTAVRLDVIPFGNKAPANQRR